MDAKLDGLEILDPNFEIHFDVGLLAGFAECVLMEEGDLKRGRRREEGRGERKGQIGGAEKSAPCGERRLSSRRVAVFVAPREASTFLAVFELR